MKAMYEVTYRNKSDNELSDSRTWCFQASAAGFQQAVSAAVAAAEKHEYVAGVQQVMAEKE